MNELTHFNPTGRFSGLAGLYSRHRPDYPATAVDLILQRCGLNRDTPLLDVGCGTGISTRLFAARGIPAIGIEPNDEMRAEAEATPFEPLVSGARPPEYRKGTAEATGLPGGFAAVVLAAQAFHWFDAPVALREFHRILRPGGWAALLWNERDESDPFTAAYGTVVRTSPDTAAVEGPRGRAGEALLHCPLFLDPVRESLRHEQELDEEGVRGRAFSTSYAPREPNAVAVFAEALRQVFRAHQHGGKVVMHYQTSIYLGRRADSPQAASHGGRENLA
jgi:SAM-dependent methyltransferase